MIFSFSDMAIFKLKIGQILINFKYTIPAPSHLKKRDLGTIFTNKRDFKDQFTIKIGSNLKKRDHFFIFHNIMRGNYEKYTIIFF